MPVEAQPNPSPNSAIHTFIKATCQMMRLVIPPGWQFAIVVWNGRELVYENTDPDNVAAARAFRGIANWLEPSAKA